MEDFEALSDKTNQEELIVYDGNGYDTNADVDSPAGTDEKMTETPQESYSVKYNGKEVMLTLDELKTNAQKGLNYDHVKGEFDTLKNSPMMKTLEELANAGQMTKEEFVMALAGKGAKEGEKGHGSKETANDGAKRIAQLEENERQRALQKEKDAPYIEFAEKFPSVRPEDIPVEVWRSFEKSGSLVMAYMEYENRRLSGKIRMLEKNAENTKRSIGAAKSGAKANADPFLEGLYS